MNKNFLLLISAGALVLQAFPKDIPSLGTLATKTIFDSNNWNLNKAKINQKLLNKEIPPEALKFNKLVLEDMDFSGMHLNDIQFTNCKFINVNLENADLR